MCKNDRRKLIRAVEQMWQWKRPWWTVDVGSVNVKRPTSMCDSWCRGEMKSGRVGATLWSPAAAPYVLWCPPARERHTALHCFLHFPTKRPVSLSHAQTHPIHKMTYSSWSIRRQQGSLAPANLYSLKPEPQPLIEPEMTDEFICHASTPRQWL